MALTYPLTPPSPFRIARLSLTGVSAASRNVSPFTFQVQQYNWPGQAWFGQVECPPMVRADAEAVVAFLLAAQRGTFLFGDYANQTNRGGVTGTLTVSTATANTSTLTFSGATGSFALGDWLQISTSLYKVVQVNSSSSVDVFPVLRASYAAGTAITYANAQGVFRLAEPSTDWSIDLAKIYGVSFAIVEDVA
ncbi:MAG: hypothetical protein FJ184_02010 [Gammaproteobacteria bacterium]|nr:hypothetical protein [Gammaproteobacteria bacterium]